MRDVLRVKTGDDIELVDSAGTLFHARVDRVGGDVVATLQTATEPTDAIVSLEVAQGIPKGQKMDFVVEKLSELGASRILPLQSERAVVRVPGEEKIERWRRLARTAAQQSGRRSIAEITAPLELDALLARFRDYDVVLVPWELSLNAARLRDDLPDLVRGAVRILVVVGPEGGFSHDEVEHMRAAGAHVISLGARILRTETAALVVLAILQYLLD